MFEVRKRRLETAEFALLVECCGRAITPANAKTDERLLPAELDWEVFLALARRHRVQGLVWRDLHSRAAELAPAVADALAEDARTIAQDGMMDAAESARLLKAFNAAGVAVLFVKGLSLAQLAYGDPFVKMSSDIDILIGGDQLDDAVAALRRLEYELVIPAANGAPNRLRRWHQSRKESVWVTTSENMNVELHTRLTDNLRLLPGMGAGAPHQLVPVAPGVTVPTLATDELFAYLCVHGASSAWFRLKWLADLAGLLRDRSPKEISRLHLAAQKLGAGRAPSYALLLTQDFFNIALEPRLATAIAADGANRWLARMAWRQITSVAEPTATRFGTTTIHLTQFLLYPGVRFKLGELRRQLADAAGNRA